MPLFLVHIKKYKVQLPIQIRDNLTNNDLQQIINNSYSEYSESKKALDELSANYKNVMHLHFVLQQDNGDLHSHHSVWIDKEGIFKSYNIKKPTAVLIRPDKYIGFTQSPFCLENLKSYLNKIFV